jgi:CelD/BcsL family acetyltransferase involved in cellulose biosynthesis
MHGIEVIDLSPSKDYSAAPTAKTASAPRKLLITQDINRLSHVWPRSSRLGGARCYAFQCADLLKLYCDTIVPARNGEPLFVAIMDQCDVPVFLMGLTVESHYNVRVLRFIDGGLSDLNTPVLWPLAEDVLPKTIRAILSALQKMVRFDVAIFDKMPLRVGDLTNPLLGLARSKEAHSCHSMTLAKPSKIDSKKRSSQRRRLSRHGEVTFQLAETSEQFDVVIEVLIEQKTKRYLETRGTDGLSRPGYKHFLRSVGSLLYPNGPVCLFALKIDEVIVATNLGYVVGSRFYGFMNSSDTQKWREYSPGHLLTIDIANWCCAKGLTSFDFGLGDEAYKLNYCDVSTELYRVACFFTMRGGIYLVLRRGWVKGVILLQNLKRTFVAQRTAMLRQTR